MTSLHKSKVFLKIIHPDDQHGMPNVGTAALLPAYPES